MTDNFHGQILHDYFAMIGGGEKLVLSLADDFNWPLVGGFVASQLSHEFSTRPQSLNAYAGFTPLRMLSLIKTWESYVSPLNSTNPLANIIYSGVYAPLAVHQHKNSQNLLYCHTPPRFVYDKKDYYLATLPAWQRLLFKQLIAYFQKKYEASLGKMDSIIANSKHIQARIKHHTGYDSKVVYPPCDTQNFSWESQADYYLSTARLDSLKRVEQVVKAFLQMPEKKLIVASGGPEYAKLQHMVDSAQADNIHLTNWISQDRLLALVNNCIATIYIPKDEDFGISPVESMAAGKPVIGVREGGLQETIIDGETGFLLDGEEDLSKQLTTLISSQLSPKQALELRQNCELRAKQFSQAIFFEQMTSLLKSA